MHNGTQCFYAFILVPPVHNFTFVGEAHQSTSWLDHCVSNSLGHNNIVDMEVLYDCVSGDHLPLMLCIKSTDIINNNVTLDNSSVGLA